MSGPIALAFGIWMLLTADFSMSNILLGVCSAVFVARLFTYRFSVWQLLYLTLSFFVRTFQAVWEAISLIALPRQRERVVEQRLAHARNPWAVFSQILILTFTPKTLVTKTRERGVVEVHTLNRGGDA